ncbi:XTP/dITP diphosphatase [Syntrophomonas palmitatica]|uniref:XTP/dITP diphosphatase n=1 Tax=Syntrophomonas palmitatica TaxID=402877 RepID=UPI0006D09307|nr:XTP/dITP diphosphatase [Syntrophomonas palmitatica]
MNKTLLLATRNRHKQRELQDMLAGTGIQVINLDNIPDLPEVEEDGATFTENAAKKARVIAAASGMLCLADDSGLEVDALNGRPGVFSARFAGPDADDEKNNALLLHMLRDVPEEKRRARFVCVIAIADPQGNLSVAEGACPGTIGFAPHGSQGFGYDPLFIPQGYKQSFAELGAEVKNSISHRGQALAKAKPLLQELFNR